MTIKVRDRHAMDIPYGGSYIIKGSRKEYHAYTTIYDVTCCETFSTLREASQWLE